MEKLNCDLLIKKNKKNNDKSGIKVDNKQYIILIRIRIFIIVEIYCHLSLILIFNNNRDKNQIWLNTKRQVCILQNVTTVE